MTVREALDQRGVVLDMLEEGRLQTALWLAGQVARALELAASFVSLVGEPVAVMFVERLVWTADGLRRRACVRSPRRVARENRVALQAAVDVAVSAGGAGGGVIHLPPGQFHLGGPSVVISGANVTLFGSPGAMF